MQEMIKESRNNNMYNKLTGGKNKKVRAPSSRATSVNIKAHRDPNLEFYMRTK